jgi:hypothetical protein
MLTQVNLIPINSQGSTILQEHFGLNFVADFERIGDRPWEKFDEIARNIGTTSVRYPGGVTAESIFDYRDPNRTEVTLPNGEIVKITALSAFIKFCNLMQINPTIIVPTASLLTDERTEGHRSFDTNQSEDLQRFIEGVLRDLDPRLKASFEIGNEYEGHMTSTEYGRVASAIVRTVDQAFTETQSSGFSLTQEPDTFVQAWGYSVGGGLSPDEIFERNLTVISQFNSGDLEKVDGVVSHYYYMDGRNAGTEFEQSLDAIESQAARIADLHGAWEFASGRELLSRVSEWNVLMRSELEIGLRQLQPLMEMFTSFVNNGFDALDFWSTQYKATSLADSSGRLMAAGVLLDTLRANIIGTEITQAESFDQISVYSFSDELKQVSVIASKEAEVVSIDLANSSIMQGYSLVNGFIIGVDESTADGKYRDLSGLPAYGEPDARVTLNQIPMSVIKGIDGVIALEPFECLVLIFVETNFTHSVVFGTDYADVLYGGDTRSHFVGGAGWDLVNYLPSGSGIDIQLDQITSSQEYTSDTFVSIEAVIGSDWNDQIIGSEEGNVLAGWGGDDYISGLLGDDTLHGGFGNDTINGGLGNDELRGDDGDDVFLLGMGSDSVFGGPGLDTIDFSDSNTGITVWTTYGKIESEGGLVSFSSIERFVGSGARDRFVVADQYSEIYGADGDDSFLVNGVDAGGSFVSGGDGDDHAQLNCPAPIFIGGAGRDSMISIGSNGDFSGGDGNDRAVIIGDSWVLDGGHGDDYFHITGDRFLFKFSDDFGHDMIYGFDPTDDELSFLSSGGGLRVEVVDGGSLISVDSGGSIFLSGVSIDDPSSLLISFT